MGNTDGCGQSVERGGVFKEVGIDKWVLSLTHLQWSMSSKNNLMKCKDEQFDIGRRV